MSKRIRNSNTVRKDLLRMSVTTAITNLPLAVSSFTCWMLLRQIPQQQHCSYKGQGLKLLYTRLATSNIKFLLISSCFSFLSECMLDSALSLHISTLHPTSSTSLILQAILYMYIHLEKLLPHLLPSEAHHVSCF